MWQDADWTGRQLAGSVIYELHIGTFTPEGTLDSAIARLDHLVDLGIGFVELLPVNAFNGTHNWGYDGVLWYAVHEGYGGPAAYQRFVDACHRRGLGVIQDVVHNHLGPSGNYLPEFGPYLRAAERNTWGSSIDLDEPEVRRYIVENALMWMRDHHVDGLRLDAVHALKDSSARHILQELAEATDALSAHVGRPLTLIAESDLNDATLIAAREAGGLRPDGPVERRLPPRRARRRLGRDRRLLRGLRAAVGAGQGRDRRLLPRRQLVVLPRAGARSPDRPAHSDLPPGDVQSGPRPDRKPRRGRPALAVTG